MKIPFKEAIGGQYDWLKRMDVCSKQSSGPTRVLSFEGGKVHGNVAHTSSSKTCSKLT
jgi:hypothetical protein